MNNDKTYALTSGYPSTSFLFFSYIIKAFLKETLTTDGSNFEVWDALGLDFVVEVQVVKVVALWAAL